MLLKSPRFAFALFAALLSAVAGRATIDATLQMQLGNPSSAASDPANHDHYLIQRAQYALDFSDHNGEPNWVSWDLTSADIGASGRSNFIPDPTLPAGFYAVTTNDYTGSGYDRGHMCPSADRTITTADNQILFYMSNILPQAPDNNQGVWENFESYCRSQASAGNEVLITCGPSSFSGSRIPSGVAAIPGYVWKIAVVVPLGSGTALSRITTDTRVIAIKIPNIQGVRSDPWQKYLTSVAQIEADTGDRFFTALPDAVAAALRVKLDGQSAAGSPSIVVQPAAQTTVVGGAVSFSVTAGGDAPLSYQWLKDDDEIPGATTPTLTLNTVQAGDAGNYYVVVTNGVGSTTSNVAALVITGLPPAIATPPAGQTVSAGGNVTFSVSASGSPTLAYQWRKDAAPIGGATGAALTLADVQSGDAGSYDVVVTNSVSSVTSAAAALVVNPVAPAITAQPAATAAVTGGSATFTVAAGGSAPLGYQWRKNGSPLANGGVVSGADTATLTLTGVAAGDAGGYDVVVSNALGSATSSPAALTVNAAAPNAVVWDFTTAAPTSGLSAGLSGGTVTQGNNNGTTALISSTSASSGYAGASGGNNAGAAARTGAFNPASSAYFEFTLVPAPGRQVTATGLSFGERSTSTGPVSLAVYTSVDNFTSPVAVDTVSNTSAWTLRSPAFTGVAGAADAPVTFRLFGFGGSGSAQASTANWRIDDLKLTVAAGFPTPVPPVVTAVSPVAGATGVAPSSAVTVTFNEAVNLVGSWFSIASAANGPMAATVNGGPTTFTLTPPENFPGSDTITVTIAGSQVVDQASGTLHGASNTTFSFTTAAFTPPAPPSITSQPLSQTVNAGVNVVFSVGASGTAPLSYQWRKQGTPLVGNSSATTASLALTSVTTADGGGYDCVVSNAAGSNISQVATLVVNLQAPAITTAPVAQTAPVGGTATLTVAASGAGPLTYQWRKGGVSLSNGGVVSGADTATLTLTGVTAADSGAYDVVVTNAVGSTTTAPVTLAVTAAAPSAIYWDFSAAGPTSGVPASIGVSPLTQGNNNGTTQLLTAVSAASGYPGVSGGNNAGAAAHIGPFSAASSTYFEFTLTPAGGPQVSVTGMSFGLRSTGTGPQAFGIYTSADNFAAPVAAGAVANDSVWRLITPAFAGVTGAAGSPLTLRIYGYNGAGSPGAGTANWRIDDLNVTAGILAVPAVPPTIAGTSPANGALGVAVSSAITITFNEAVNVTGSWFSVTSAANGPIAATVSGGPTTFTLTPPSGFAFGDTITTRIFASQVTDQATGTLPLASDTSFSFGTVPPPLVPPGITLQPAAQTVVTGANASFAIAASGSAPLVFQWRKAGTPLSGNPSAATATLALVNVTAADAGSYDCVVSNAAGSVTSGAATLTVNKAVATVVLSGLSATYDGSPKGVTVTTNPPGLAVTVLYNGVAALPVAAGAYGVTATVTDPGYTGTASGTLTIGKASAAITLGNLKQAYDGTPKSASVTTSPAGLAVDLTYNGSASPPTAPGSYAVLATIDNPSYAEGGATGTLVITVTALVRHAPGLNGDIDGSLQVLSGESLTLNGGAMVSGDLLVPGEPDVRLNGNPTYGGALEGVGSASPSNYTVTLNGNAVLRHVVRRTDPIAMPVIGAPPAPAGTRTVSINAAGQSAGDFTTIRNLTLNGNVGQMALPAGTYGNLTANGASGFTLGVPGATEPAIYNLQNLTINGGGQLQIVGPVILTLANSVTLNGTVGSSAHPEWLTCNISSGGLTLNGNVALNGSVVAPNGTIIINGSSVLNGEIICDRLTVNGNGLLNDAGE